MRWLLLLLLALAAQAQRHVLLVDCSGSMQGFFATGVVDQVGQLVRQTCPTAPREQGFLDNTTITLPACAPPPRFGRITHISQAFQRELDGAQDWRFLWILTDNIQTGGTVGPDMAAFYNQLHRGKRVASVCFYPLIVPFDGMLFQAVSAPNKGPRGLLLYQIEIDLPSTESSGQMRRGLLDEMREELAEQRGWISSAVQIRPFQKGDIDVRYPDSKVRRVKSRDQLVISNHGKAHDTGRPIRFQQEVQVFSRLREFTIAHVDVSPVIHPPRHRHFTVQGKDVRVACTPNYIKDLNQRKTVDVIKTDVHLAGFGIHNRPGTLWHCFQRGMDTVRVDLDLEFCFQKKDIQFDDSIVRSFKAHIPGLDDLAGSISADSNVVRGKKLTLLFPMNYPLYPVLLILGGGLLLLILLVVLAGRIRHRGRWTLRTSEQEERSVCPLFMGVVSFHSVRATYWAGSWHLRPAAGYQLNPSRRCYPGHAPFTCTLEPREPSLEDQLLQDGLASPADHPVELWVEPGLGSSDQGTSERADGRGTAMDTLDII